VGAKVRCKKRGVTVRVFVSLVKGVQEKGGREKRKKRLSGHYAGGEGGKSWPVKKMHRFSEAFVKKEQAVIRREKGGAA